MCGVSLFGASPRHLPAEGALAKAGLLSVAASDFHSPVAPELGRSTAGLGSPGAQAPEPPSCSSSVLALS